MAGSGLDDASRMESCVSFPPFRVNNGSLILKSLSWFGMEIKKATTSTAENRTGGRFLSIRS
jgi:hypothetical protein